MNTQPSSDKLVETKSREFSKDSELESKNQFLKMKQKDSISLLLTTKNLFFMIISALGTSMGLLLTRIDSLGYGNLHEYLYYNSMRLVGYLSIFFGIILAAIVMLNLLKIKNSTYEKKFVDVDENINKAKNEDLKIEIEKLKNLLMHKKNEGEANLPCSVEIISKQTFCNYSLNLKASIDARIGGLDEKASIMLDKGTSYAKFGIGFYITTIIFWQIWFLFGGIGFKTEHILGIVSCTVLFFFVEFLSAWFMKQYQHFIDTSTYMTKIKSIFDKYMMSYLALIELSGEKVSDEHIEKIIELLSQEIKWPDSSSPFNKKDVTFAKEAFETMSTMVRDLASIKGINLNDSKEKKSSMI